MIEANTQGYLVHICQRGDWETALGIGEYRASSLAKEGFIHCSLPYQVLEVANHFYREVPDLVLLWIAPQQVGPKIIFEHPPGESKELYPHIYGPLNLDAIVSVDPFPIQEDGFFHSLPTPSGNIS
jgi:uncharacterized protein (DUF952 family)